MNKEKIREFFNAMADSWDQGMVINEAVIKTILDNAAVREGIDVLDVASGTGVLIPFYLSRNVRSVTAIDVSERMSAIAAQKFSTNGQVRVICADVLGYLPDRLYDVIVVYNALPHFPDDEQLISALSAMLEEGGRLTIAHGMSRERINEHHRNVSPEIRKPLKPVEELAEIMARHLQVEITVSTDSMYQIVGRKL